jgi:D-glycero-D-manno-heptose 1,7-bisphosphate phosphatase
MKNAVFLDRDGVINKTLIQNHKPYPPKTLDDLNFLPRVKEACEMMTNAGWLLIVITNQPDVARGKVSINEVKKINNYLMKQLPLSEIKTCYHDDIDNCSCRKPKPGLIIEASRNYNINLSSSYFVGDRWRDMEAGQRSGCKTIFIDYNYKEKRPVHFDHCVKSLYEATKIILGI